ncbi:Auxin-responsive protein SAUR72, partial [Cucurbita argyrosperma subsp. argyrosperma]
MRQLLRRLSRVADSSQYCLLRSGSPSSAATNLRRSCILRSSTVPQGHVPVYVGKEMERFVVSAQLLNHPVFVELLDKSAQEYGYEQKGVLHIPCHVLLFERVLEALSVGDYDSRRLQDLLSNLSIES